MERLQYATSTPTITSGAAYASGNLIGTMMTFSGIALRGFSSLYSVVITDKAAQSAAMDLILFSAPLTSTLTDKSAVAINAADLANCIGNIKVLAADYSALGTPSVALEKSLFAGLIGTGTDANSVYGILVSRGTPTYASTTDLTVKLAAEIGIL